MNVNDKLLLDFGNALKFLRNGAKITRNEWTDIEFIYLVPGSSFKVNRAPLLGIYEEGTQIEYNPHIDAKFKDGSCGVWNPTNRDILACDWYLVD